MNDKQLEVIQSWGELKARAFEETWTVDDEQMYQQLFSKPNKVSL